MWQHKAVSLADELGVKTAPLLRNAHDLSKECDWLKQLIHSRLSHYFDQNEPVESWKMHAPPSFNEPYSPYAEFMVVNAFTPLERLLIVLALVPVVKPEILDVLLSVNEQTSRIFSEFGMTEHSGCIYATGATAAFITGGTDVISRCEVLQVLCANNELKKVLAHQAEDYEPSTLSAPLALNFEYTQKFTTGMPYQPESNQHFAATAVRTNMTWPDLSLSTSIQNQLNEIVQWVKHGKTLLNDWHIGKQLRPGYRALFYGPPGTGKTLTAGLLGQEVDMEVYKIDLSMVTSKYIGETEKNLEQVFNLAEHRNWILFFDEADALFGKRQSSNSANDQFANQNVAYLLQRIERFNGVVLLASNFKDNIDNAFFRRFESVIHFELPKPAQRLKMWQSGFCGKTRLSADVDLQQLADQYPLSGADIINVIRCVSLKLISENRADVRLQDIHDAINRLQGHRSLPRW